MVPLEYPDLGTVTLENQMMRRKMVTATQLELLMVPATTHIIITYPLP